MEERGEGDADFQHKTIPPLRVRKLPLSRLVRAESDPPSPVILGAESLGWGNVRDFRVSGWEATQPLSWWGQISSGILPEFQKNPDGNGVLKSGCSSAGSGWEESRMGNHLGASRVFPISVILQSSGWGTLGTFWMEGEVERFNFPLKRDVGSSSF